jgi:4-hydroxy-tetrahydrodipicolinate synthase
VIGNDPARALELHQKLMPLHTALFCEASPGPVKYAASLLGIAGATTRQPLVEIEDSSKRAVEAALKAAELL